MVKVNHISISTISANTHKLTITLKSKDIIKNATLTFESVSNRSGFKHQGECWANVQHFVNGKEDYNQYENDYEKGKIQYYNRTWESYNFQSLILKLLRATGLFTSEEVDKIDNAIEKAHTL